MSAMPWTVPEAAAAVPCTYRALMHERRGTSELRTRPPSDLLTGSHKCLSSHSWESTHPLLASNCPRMTAVANRIMPQCQVVNDVAYHMHTQLQSKRQEPVLQWLGPSG